MKANRRIANRMEGARKSLFYFYAVPSNSEMYNWRLGVGQVRSNWRKYFSSMEAANSRRNLIKKWFMECRWVGVGGGGWTGEDASVDNFPNQKLASAFALSMLKRSSFKSALLLDLFIHLPKNFLRIIMQSTENCSFTHQTEKAVK